MTRDDINRLAQEAGFEKNSLGWTYTQGYLGDHLERFAALVAAAELRRLHAVNEELAKSRDGAYTERNRLVALLSTLFPSGKAKTAIDGWDESWHGCVYIDFPWGQASWHYHDSEAHLFAHLPPYQGQWDGHTTEQKYAAIDAAIAKAGGQV